MVLTRKPVLPRVRYFMAANIRQLWQRPQALALSLGNF
jgi:hypothetical protein